MAQTPLVRWTIWLFASAALYFWIQSAPPPSDASGNPLRIFQTRPVQTGARAIASEIVRHFGEEVPRFPEPQPVTQLRGVSIGPGTAAHYLFQSSEERFRVIGKLPGGWFEQVDSLRPTAIQIRRIDNGWPEPVYTGTEAQRNLPELARLIRDPRSGAAPEELLETIADFGKLAGPTLLAIAQDIDVDEPVRARSLEHWAAVAPKTPETLDVLRLEAAGESPLLRLAAIRQLAVAGEQPERHLVFALAAAERQDRPVRESALETLGRLDQHESDARRALERHARSDDGSLRTVANLALARLSGD